MNGRPLSTRKKFQILILLTILVWATQTMLHQWGFGAEISTRPGPTPDTRGAVDNPLDKALEKFVPSRDRAAAGATLEMREEASVYGGEARLKQVCRWSDADASVFLPVADLILMRIDANTNFKPIGLDELKTTLHDAGVNLAFVRFSGPTLCTVRRTDARVGDGSLTLDQWIQAKHGGKSPDAPRVDAPRVDAPPARPTAAVADPPATRSLRSLLLDDLAVRLNLPAEQLQVGFNPKDENLLNLSEPQFRFNLDARRVRNLGDVEWEVTVFADGGSRKAPVLATARAWQAQVVVNKPLSYRQLLREGDVTQHRALVDRVGEEPLLTLPQVVGQQASRDLKPGTVMTARMVDAVPLAKPGQLITLTTTQGNVRVKTVARSLEGGSFGQTIHVKNDATNDFYDVVLTGPQEGTVGAQGVSTDAAKLAAAR